MKIPFLFVVVLIALSCTNKIVNSDQNDSSDPILTIENEAKVEVVKTPLVTKIDSLFPQSWEGKWGGTLEIFKGFTKGYETPMELHILPDPESKKYSWHIIYGEDKVEGLRPYDLHIVDPTKGLYRVDENNSIAIETYYFADKFVSLFEVQGSLLLSSVEKRGDQLVWEIFAGNMEPVSVTGDTIMGMDTISAVQTFPINVMQRAVLSQIDE